MIAVLSIAHNEEDIIGQHIKMWTPYVDEYLLLLSNKPWNGSTNKADSTEEIARYWGATIQKGEWKTEHEQRNAGLHTLHDYDFVIVSDPDEFYIKKDLEKIVNRVKDKHDYENNTDGNILAFKAKKVQTYWKTTDYIFEPADSHQPIIAVNPKYTRFFDKRAASIINDVAPIDFVPEIDVLCHHLSWAKTNEKALEKIQTYAHAGDIPNDWYEEVWKKWTPGCTMRIRPYGIEKSVAVFNPAPEEIKELVSV